MELDDSHVKASSVISCPEVTFSMHLRLERMNQVMHSRHTFRAQPVTMAELGVPGTVAQWSLGVTPQCDALPPGLKDHLSVWVDLNGMEQEEEVLAVVSFFVNIPRRNGTTFSVPMPSQLNVRTRFASYSARYRCDIPHSKVQFLTYFISGKGILDVKVVIKFVPTTVYQAALTPLPQALRNGLVKRICDGYKLGLHTDFMLISSDGREFPVHQFVLAVGSPVFAAMLSHDTAEKASGRCTMKDVDGETLDVLLKFMYGCDVSGVEAVRGKLTKAADEYDVADLHAYLSSFAHAGPK